MLFTVVRSSVCSVAATVHAARAPPLLLLVTDPTRHRPPSPPYPPTRTGHNSHSASVYIRCHCAACLSHELLKIKQLRTLEEFVEHAGGSLPLPAPGEGFNSHEYQRRLTAFCTKAIRVHDPLQDDNTVRGGQHGQR